MRGVFFELNLYMYRLKADYEHYANITITTSEGDVEFDHNRESEVSEAIANIFKEIKDPCIHISKQEQKVKVKDSLSVDHSALNDMVLSDIKKLAIKAGLNSSEVNGKGKTKDYIIALIIEKDLELKY